MTRQEAFALLEKYNRNPNLIKHALAVEAVMRYFARQKGEDEEYWGNVGLLHDLDYDLYPDQHCVKTKELMESEGVADDIIHAAVSHGWNICIDVEPVLPMEKVLYTVDELTGLITAVVYMRPDKSIETLEVKSVKKKFKTPSFAAGVNRELILSGCEMISMELDTVIQWTIDGMKEAASDLGLKGI